MINSKFQINSQFNSEWLPEARVHVNIFIYFLFLHFFNENISPPLMYHPNFLFQ